MKQKILVIDDEANIRKLYNDILVNAGYDVVTSSASVPKQDTIPSPVTTTLFITNSENAFG